MQSNPARKRIWGSRQVCPNPTPPKEEAGSTIKGILT